MEHPEFTLSCDDSPITEITLPSFAANLERRVLLGERFRSGETLQVGWVLTQLRALDDGSLAIFEPTFASIPIEWAEGVGRALHHLFVQREMASGVGLLEELEIPSLQQSAILCSRLKDTTVIWMDRTQPLDPADSGWFLGCEGLAHDHNNPEDLLRMSLYEIAIRQSSDFVSYIGLPIGCQVLAGSDPPAILRNGVPLAFEESSLLAAMKSRMS